MVASDGVPFEIDRFRFNGRIPPLDASLVARTHAGKPVPTDGAGSGRHVDELLLGRDVVSFAGG